MVLATNPTDGRGVMLSIPDPGHPPGLEPRQCDACQKPTEEQPCRKCTILLCTECKGNGYTCQCPHQETLAGGIHWSESVCNSRRFEDETYKIADHLTTKLRDTALPIDAADVMSLIHQHGLSRFFKGAVPQPAEPLFGPGADKDPEAADEWWETPITANLDLSLIHI